MGIDNANMRLDIFQDISLLFDLMIKKIGQDKKKAKVSYFNLLIPK